MENTKKKIVLRGCNYFMPIGKYCQDLPCNGKGKCIGHQDADEDEGICDTCEGTGEVEKLEHVTGDNIIPGGFWEGSGEFERCPDCNSKEEE